jgi:lysophospholipase L1-like esterase
MIKNFKWLLLVSLTFVACNSDDDDTAVINSSDGKPLTSGTADFSKYVALGNSLCAGYSDGALFKTGQQGSYSNILSQQFALVGGGEFKIPYMEDDNGGFTNAGAPLPGFGPRLYFNNSVTPTHPSPSLDVVPDAATTPIETHLTGPFNNMGVPGAKSFHLLYDGYGNPANLGTGTANPYFVRFASSPSATILGDAMAQSPTFFSLWIGNNDVLGYATSGGDGSSPLTPVNGAPGAGFDGTYNYLVATLTSAGAKGVVANIPNVTSIPFFTTVPTNPLSKAALGQGNEAVGEATINALNAQLYGPLNQALTAFGAGDRIQLLSTTVSNPLLMKDESLTDLSAQLTAAFTPTLGLATATFYGQVFGQARQAKAGDLVLLTTQSAIGTAPAGIPAPLNKFGITYPLQDKHILIPSEITAISDATAAYNIIIADAAAAKDLAIVDTNALMTQLASGGFVSDGYLMTSTLVTGGAFSLDGVHPSPRGYAFIANKFLEVINAKYGSNFKNVNVGKYRILYPKNPAAF